MVLEVVRHDRLIEVWVAALARGRTGEALVPVRKHIETSESFVIQDWWPDSRRVTDVEGEEPRTLRPQRIAISERSDRRRMGVCRTVGPPAKRGGNKRHIDVREVMNGIMYVLSTGCQWRAIPKDLPPRSTVHDYLDLWSYDGTLDRIHHALYVECRERGEREASPTAAIIDSQSVKSDRFRSFEIRSLFSLPRADSARAARGRG